MSNELPKFIDSDMSPSSHSAIVAQNCMVMFTKAVALSRSAMGFGIDYGTMHVHYFNISVGLCSGLGIGWAQPP